MGKIEIKKGDKYGMLTIIKEVEPHIEPSGRKRKKVQAKCDCGNIKDVWLTHIRRGTTISCGCLTGEKHGLSGHYLYKTWGTMKQRCYNPNNHKYPLYGGRGIRVCDRWLNSFSNFLKDMGDRPEGMTLDRFPNKDGNYEPNNCRWATDSEQNYNRRSYTWSKKKKKQTQLKFD